MYSTKKLIKKLFLVLVVFAGFQASAFSQKKIFDLESLFTSRDLYAKNLPQLQWIPDVHEFVYVEDSMLNKGNIMNHEIIPFVFLSHINEALAAGNVDAVLRRFPYILHWDSSHTFYFKTEIALVNYNTEKRTITKQIYIPNEAQNIEYDFKRGQVAYTIDNDLFVVDQDNKPVRVNNEQPKDVRFGHIVHRNEFGVDKGSFWSPSGSCLAFYRMDESMVADYPLVNTTTQIATLKNEKYPMTGQKSHEVTLGIYNLKTSKTVYIKTGEPKDQYLCCVTWSPDEKHIYIAILNRGQNHLQLNQYDAITGNFIKTLLEEKNDRYVEPSHPLFFNPKRPNEFVWVSRRDGWNHLYLYNVTDRSLRQLTHGNWEVKDFLGFDKFLGNRAYFYANKDETVGNHFYTLDIDKNILYHITPEKGTHRVQPSFDGAFYLDAYNSLEITNEIVLKDINGKARDGYLLKNSNHLSDYALPQTEIFSIKNKNGDDLYCRLIKPINFNPKKKYPVFVYVYGGPHSQMVTNSWLSGGWFLHYMAQKGYVVFTLDNRGTNYRGFEFESAIHRQLGTLEVEDQMCGVEYLKKLSYVDTNKLSIDGWSYGGFMTISMFLKHPGVFNIASCGGPVIDWKYYEVMYGERYMGTPYNNREGYKNSSLLNYTQNLKGKLLVIHGAMDPTVVWQNSLQFINECIKQKKQVDYFVYPTHEHNVRGIDRVHLWKKVEEYHKPNLNIK